MIFTNHVPVIPMKHESNKIKKDKSNMGVLMKGMSNSNDHTRVPPRINSYNDISKTAHKLLVARHMKLINQNDEIENLKRQIESLNLENRHLKTQNYRQEKELNNLDCKEMNIPKLLEQNENDKRLLREQLRKVKSLLTKEQTMRQEADKEVVKLRASLHKYRDSPKDKDLLERCELQNQLSETQKKLLATQEDLNDAQTKLDMVDKNYRTELANIRKNIRFYSNQYLTMETKYHKLNEVLKEKEKMLEIQNIYTNRISWSKVHKSLRSKSMCNSYACCHSNDFMAEVESTKLFPTHSTVNKKTKTIQMKSERSKSMDSNENKYCNLNKEIILNTIREVIKQEMKIKGLEFSRPTMNLMKIKPYRSIQPVSEKEILIPSPFIALEYDKSELSSDSDCEERNLVYEEPEFVKFEKNIIKPIIKVSSNVYSKIDFCRPVCGNLQMKCNSKTRELMKKKTENEEEDNDDDDEAEEVSQARDRKSQTITERFMRPHNNLVSFGDDWWSDMETITLMNEICDVSNSFYKKDKGLASLSRNNSSTIRTKYHYSHNDPDCCDRVYQPIEKLYKLPEIIRQDLTTLKSCSSTKYLSIPKDSVKSSHK